MAAGQASAPCLHEPPCSWSQNSTCKPAALKLATDSELQVRVQTNHIYTKDSDTYDIYLLPPGEDVETCTSWLRMRNRDGRYNLMFEEWVTDGPFIISPRITFEVSEDLLPGSLHARWALLFGPENPHDPHASGNSLASGCCFFIIAGA